MTCSHYHKSEPEGYVAKLEWLEKMSKRYKQVRCEKCGLYAIWKSKEVSDTTNKDSTDDTCVFCDLPSIKGVTELTKNVVMFEPLKPVVKGHRLFVHRTHTKHAGRSPKVSAEVFEQASKYAGEQACPFNIITSGGKDATQTVFHLHIHYVPRQKNDGLLLPWSGIQHHIGNNLRKESNNE